MINRFCHVKPHLAANTLPQSHLSKNLRYKYLGITISTEEMQTIVTSISSELKMWHNQQRNKCKRIKNKSRERRIKNYLTNVYYQPSWRGYKTGKNCLKQKYSNYKKIQGKALKSIFNLSITTPYMGLTIQTGVWSAEQRINFSSLMLYNNIINSSKVRLTKQIIQEQKSKILLRELNVKLNAEVTMKKSELKRRIKIKLRIKLKKG